MRAGQPRPSELILAVVLTILVIVVLAHIGSAIDTRNSPPFACQLLGGHWDIWNGWRCE